MHILRSLLIVCLALVSTVSCAQTLKDTLIDGRPFVVHKVQKKETLYGISREYKTELNEIVVNNPAVIQGLKKGMRLLVPLQKPLNLEVKQEGLGDQQIAVEEKKSSTIAIEQELAIAYNDHTARVALLLPFFLDMNDTLEAHNDSKKPTAIYPKSDIAISYYMGVQLALDTLEKLGYQIDLKVLDVPNDSILEVVVDSTILEDRQMIVGPLYNRQFQLLSGRFGNDSSKVLISPLSSKSVIGRHDNAFQIVPLPKTQVDSMVQLIKKQHKGEQLLLVGQESEKQLFKHAKVQLLGGEQALRFKQHLFEEGGIPSKEVLYELLDEKRNMVFIPSNDRSFVSRVLPFFGSMEDTSFTVYGLDAWNRFDNLDMDDLVNLEVHIPSVFYHGGDSLWNDFVQQCFNRYHTYPNKYSYIAYKQMLYFIGTEFVDLFGFKLLEGRKGWQNTLFPIIKYENYQRVECVD